MIIGDIEYYSHGTRVIDIGGKRKRTVYYLDTCPHCNSGKRLKFVRADADTWRLTCLDCKASTLPFYSKDMAIDSVLWPSKNIRI